jgi:anti-anti-sigma factor
MRAPFGGPLSQGSELRPQRSCLLVRVEGELDCATVPRLAEKIDELRALGWDDIVLEVAALSFIDSTRLRLIRTVDARARSEGWRFTLHGECAALERLLAVTRLEDRFVRT